MGDGEQLRQDGNGIFINGKFFAFLVSGNTPLSKYRSCPAAGSDWFSKNQEVEKISSEIFDADVEEPAAPLPFHL
jgi:hypothetical protein